MTTAVVLRVMTVDDETACQQLWRRCQHVQPPAWREDGGLKRFIGRNPTLGWVALCGQRLIGALLGSGEEGNGYLHHLAVDPDWHERGIDRALVTRCLAQMAERGFLMAHVIQPDCAGQITPAAQSRVEGEGRHLLCSGYPHITAPVLAGYFADMLHIASSRSEHVVGQEPETGVAWLQGAFAQDTMKYAGPAGEGQAAVCRADVRPMPSRAGEHACVFQATPARPFPQPVEPIHYSDQAAAFVGKPFIYEGNRSMSLHFDIGAIQSRMNLDDPNRLVLAYTRLMMGFLLLNANPEQIGMIGLGGGSLAKYCYRYLPDSRISVAEISREVIALREQFFIPPDDARFSVHCEDGAAFVRRQPATFDVLLVDGFDLRGQARQLCTQGFYDACFDSLRDQGVLVVNLSGIDHRTRAYIARIRRSFGHEVLVAKTLDRHNQIIFAVKGIGSGQTNWLHVAQKSPLRALDPSTFEHVFEQLDEWLACHHGVDDV